MKEKKNIEVVSGDGSNLSISPVYDHLNVSVPKTANNKPKYVVIPEETHKKNKSSKSDNSDDKKKDKEKKEN